MIVSHAARSDADMPIVRRGPVNSFMRLQERKIRLPEES